ncbi:unnamed protein product [Trifolium pratense]|uniref:Uncharacterized protein n=1 Tax=Trifolium pratense TaxID=57577 RepID=A0ACB0JK96_TRIPR|nr:unnamed protein product [Trifolium pratense]
MAEYVKNIAEKDPWDRWEKMHARNNVAFDRILSKLEILLQHYNCLPSSSHGASNSSKDIPTSEPFNVNLPIQDEIRSSAKQIEVLAKPISESLSVIMPTQDELLPPVEQINIPSPLEQSLSVEMVTPTSDLIEDVLDLSATKLDDNKFQPYELITKGRKFSAISDTVPVVIAEQKELVIAIGKDLDQRVYFGFNFVIPDLVYDSHLAFATFAPTPVVPLSMKTALNTISTAPPQHLVQSFDPGGNSAKLFDAQKLFDYMPHRNQITWYHTSSMYVQHSFNIFGLVLCLTSDTKQWIHHILQTLKNLEINGFTNSINIDQSSTHLYVGYDLGHVLALDMGDSSLLCWTHLVDLFWQFLSVYLHWSKNHMLEVGTNYSYSLPLDIEKFNSLSTRSVAKGGVNLSKWTHMEKATAKSLYILSSFESALYVSSFMLMSLRGVVSWHQYLAMKFGEQFHLIRFDDFIEGVTLSLFLKYSKPHFLEPYKPLKEERLLLVKEWILETIANTWLCFHHKCSPLWIPETVNKRFISIALSPRNCDLILCTLRPGSYIMEPNLEDWDSLNYFLDYFQALLFGNNNVCETLEELLYLHEKLLAGVSVAMSFAKSFIVILSSFKQPNHSLGILYRMHPTTNSFPSSRSHLNQIFDVAMVKVVYFEAVVYVMTLTKVDSFVKLVIIRPWNFGLLGQLHPDLSISVVSLMLKNSPIILTCMPDTNMKHVAFLASNGTHVLVFILNLYMLSMSNNIPIVINSTPLFIITVVPSLIKIKSQHLHSKCHATIDQVECEKATWLHIGISSKLIVNIAFDLEDKITFRGVGNDMINVVLISCLFTNMLYNEEIICDIKVVEVEMMERIRHKKMLRSSSWNDALEFYHVQIMDLLEVDSLNSQIFLTEVVKTSIWTICNQFLISFAHCKQWDPGHHLELCTTIGSFKFKQWDPGKIGVVSNCYNLEDKVGFKGEGIVMNSPYWIGPNRS